MGIQLPPELAGVAAQAGVEWPEADEDRMRHAARAWRDAGTRLSSLTRDADHTARGALNAVEGSAGDAARRHWSTFVHPDHGHLTATARGCHAAADRLDHAANQVGAAKVEIVRNLVALAKNSDAANSAAAAGHPQALLGLDTAVRGTAANVTHITDNLVQAVQPTTGRDMAGVQNLVNANPGAHGPGILDPVVSTVDSTTNAVTDTARGATNVVADTAHGATNLVADTAHGATNLVADTAQGATNAVGAATNVVGDPGRGAPNLVGGTTNLVGDTVQGATGLVGDTTARGVDLAGQVAHGAVADPGVPGNPDITGPVRIPPVDAGPGHHGVLPVDAPTPPAGIGQTVQSGLAGGPVIDPATAAPAHVQPNQSAAPGPAAGGAPVGGAPAVGGPVGGGPIGGPPGGGGPAGGLPGGGAAGGGVAGGPGGPVGRPPGPVAGPGGGPGGPVGGAPGPGGPAPVDQSRARGAMTFAVPPGQVNQGPPAVPVPAKDRRDGPEMLFWVHMFPIGHMPVVSDRPARQLPPPPVDVDYAPGMRFEPGDHPEHHRVDGEQRLAELRAGVPPLRPAEGLTGGHPRVADLVEGYDPLGGQHERDWDRRYLVRLGSVTAQGISEEGKEYAWPPCEVYPEGGTAPGEAEMLAEGTVIDRFGPPGGRVFSADETEFARRSLPPEWVASGYRRYRVTRPLPVWRTVSAPWFGQPGGGERYRTTYSAVELQALGYLADITGGGE